MRYALLGAIGILAVSAASAQQPGMVIAWLDANKDGRCDLNEYLAFQAGRIAQFDQDKDGELMLAEFKASLQGRAKQNAAFLFRNANTEGGRSLSQKEFLGYHAWVFKEFVDEDGDGFMSAEEWSAVMAQAG